MDKSKFEHWQGRINEFTTEMMEDILPEDLRNTAETAVKETFKKNGIPFRKTEVKAFSEGANFMLEAMNKGNGDQMFVLAVPLLLKGIAQKLEKKVASAVDEAVKNTTGDEAKSV